jgi:GH25 family lysozyme M1 (1,4-beta-N-acetylmuramidase)
MSEVFGVDVSHYQGKIDWAKVKATGKTFAILKAQYENGNHGYDPTFLYNYKNAIANGFVTDVYDYFGSATLADPAGQATALVSKLKAVSFNGTVWMDHENAKLKGIGKTATNLMIQKYAAVIVAAGYRLGIYCNYDWHKNVLDVANFKKLYPFWIARYPLADVGAYNATSSLSPKAFGVGWQYSSKGKVNGITGNVDLDVMYSTANATTPITILATGTGKKTVIASVLNMRDGAGASNADIGDLKQGSIVTIDKVSNGWGHIKDGWISLDSKYVK